MKYREAQRNLHAKPGFTLIEIMVAAFVMLIVVAGVTKITVDSVTIVARTTQKTQITRDNRTLSMALREEAIGASSATVYANLVGDMPTTQVPNNQAGNCLVIAQLDFNTTSLNPTRFYEQIRIFYRNPEGSVYSRTLNLDINDAGAYPAATAIDDVLAAEAANFEQPIRFLQGNIEQNPFSVINVGREFMVRGTIFSEQKTKLSSSNYNYVISTRG